MERRDFLRGLCAAACLAIATRLPDLAPVHEYEPVQYETFASGLHRDFENAYARKYAALQERLHEILRTGNLPGEDFAPPWPSEIREWHA